MTPQNYDYLIIGAGHNALICANYLAKAGKKVIILEQRSQVGGAAATEEIIPGYKFSRFSYVFSIFRQKVIDELFPKDWHKELILYPTEPSLFIPTKQTGKYLTLSNDLNKTLHNISEFANPQEAENYKEFYALLKETAKIIEPLIDEAPIHSILQAIKNTPKFRLPKKHSLAQITEFLTSSSATVLDRWLENDFLKTALSYAGTVGQLQSPYSPGSAFLQLHHVANTIAMPNSTDNTKEAISYRYYPRGGMGAVSEYLCQLALKRGVKLQTGAKVKRIITENNEVKGVGTEGETFYAANIISNLSYDLTFNHLLDKPQTLPKNFQRGLKSIRYKTNCSKINIVLKDIPNFKCLAKKIDPKLNYQQRKKLACEIMHNTLIVGDDMQQLHTNYLLAEQGKLSPKPTIQMLMPSLLDDSLTPPNSQDIIALLFVEYTPYDIQGGWSETNREKFIQSVFKHIDSYAPNFSQLVKHIDAVFPPDIEEILGLTGGNIFQGEMSLDNINAHRPMPEYNQYKTPIKGLYSCSSANHPGGGVCGGAGRNAAKAILRSA
jgi:phytoene dehydrogenase-like protein